MFTILQCFSRLICEKQLYSHLFHGMFFGFRMLFFILYGDCTIHELYMFKRFICLGMFNYVLGSLRDYLL